MRVLVVTPPEPFIGLAEAKQHLKVQHDVEDALITGYIAAACSHIDGPDGWLGRALGVQTLEARFDLGPCATLIRLRYPPIVSIASVRYLDAKREEVVAEPGTSELVGDEIIAIGAPAWASAYAGREALRVRFVAGYAPRVSGEQQISTLPAAIRVAVLLMVEDLYRNRGNVTAGTRTRIDMPATSEALLQPFRVYA